MAQNFYTILTNIGKAKMANAYALGTKVNLTTLAVGDGSGAYYEPTEDQTALKNQVWSGNISGINVDSENPNWIKINAVIPTTDGGFTIREAGIIDDSGNLIAVGKYPETYKPQLSEGSSKDLTINMILEFSNTSSVTLKVDPTVILATKKDITDLQNQLNNITIPVTKVNNKTGEVVLKAADIKVEDGATLEQIKENFDTHKADYVYQIAGGTATAITLTEVVLEDGHPKTFIASADNNGDDTTINGKHFYKPGTTTSPTVKSGKAYTFWYNLISDCFFIKASAEGNTVADHVLAGDTFSNDIDTELVGTMIDNGNPTIIPTKSGLTLNAGYYSGGTVIGSYPINMQLEVGTITVTDGAETKFSSTTILAHYFAFDPTSNEVFCLNYSTRTMYVYDKTTGILNRSFIIPPNTDTNFGISTITEILISPAGRLYISGLDTANSYGLVAEINKSTGTSIKKASGVYTTSITPWLFKLINGIIYLGCWTGTLVKFDGELNSLGTLIYNNSVGNNVNKNGLRVDVDRVVYAQVSNNSTIARKLSDGTNVGSGLYGSNYQYANVTKSYILVLSSSTLYKYDLNGIQIGTYALRSADNQSISMPLNMYEIADDVIAIPVKPL